MWYELNRSLDLIDLCNTFFLSWSEQTVADLLRVQMQYTGENSYLGYIFKMYCRLESVIAKYSKHPHRCGWLTDTHTPQNIRFIRAEAVPEHSPRKQDNSASNSNSRFSNRDGDKEAKLTDCSFNLIIKVTQ